MPGQYDRRFSQNVDRGWCRQTEHAADQDVMADTGYVIGTDELRKIRAHLENLVPLRTPLPDLNPEDGLMTASGIYAFVSRGPKWGHLYLGMSIGRLSRRVNEQRHLRRWAAEVLLFPLQDLDHGTLEVLEKRLLRICAKQFAWAYLDNELDLSAPHPDPFLTVGRYPELDNLLIKIFGTIRRGLESSSGHPRKLRPTHILGARDGDIYGVAALRGGWTYLLPGSRLPSRYSNYRMITKDHAALERLEGFYRRGVIAWRARTNTRPAGFMITEPVRFHNMRSAARFLYVGETVTEAWELITPKRKT